MRLEVVYLGKGKTPYLTIKDVPTSNCIVCLENKPTTAHHIIPKRAKAKDRQISDLRGRICKSCNKIIHAENGELDGFDIIKRQARIINKLKVDLEETKKKDYSWIINELDERKKRYTKNLPRFINELKDAKNFRAIHPMMKLMEGRIKETDNIRKIIKVWINQNKKIGVNYEKD